MVTDTIP